MIPLTRHGWKEILVGTLLLGAIGFGLSKIHWSLSYAVLPFWIWLIAFFRDPSRKLPDDPNTMVSPADGTVSDITPIDHDDLLGGPAIRVGIFLSVFNVHVNRSPCPGKIASITYKKGKFINALHHNEASSQNESNTLVITQSDKPVAVVKQIVGLIARRIVCAVKIGDEVTRGGRIGMIKFGSRTELTIPQSLSPQIVVKIGQKVRGAADIIATIKSPP